MLKQKWDGSKFMAIKNFFLIRDYYGSYFIIKCRGIIIYKK